MDEIESFRINGAAVTTLLFGVLLVLLLAAALARGLYLLAALSVRSTVKAHSRITYALRPTD